MPNTRPPVDYIARTRAQYAALGYPPYRWVENDSPPPLAALRRPVAASRLTLIASGGIYVAGQTAFHHRDDTSFRIVDTQAPRDQLRVTHFAYDVADARADPDVVFPLRALHAAVADGRLGELARRAYTFMGGIYSSRKVRELLAPAIAARCSDDGTDLALLVPV
jgi:D-proline reductase (dithiol) PrdB